MPGNAKRKRKLLHKINLEREKKNDEKRANIAAKRLVAKTMLTFKKNIKKVPTHEEAVKNAIDTAYNIFSNTVHFDTISNAIASNKN